MSTSKVVHGGAGMSAVADVIDLLSDDEGVLADAHSQDAGASQQPASSSRVSDYQHKHGMHFCASMPSG